MFLVLCIQFKLCETAHTHPCDIKKVEILNACAIQESLIYFALA